LPPAYQTVNHIEAHNLKLAITASIGSDHALGCGD
jgi:hypothetical protein